MHRYSVLVMFVCWGAGVPHRYITTRFTEWSGFATINAWMLRNSLLLLVIGLHGREVSL